MTPGLRKIALTAHIATSVGWLGAVVAFLALAVLGLTGRDVPPARGAYLTMDALAWYAILPLCLAALITGVIQSLGTHWGLLRHYWVVVKLLVTLVSTFILLLHLRPIGHLAGLAADGPVSDGVYLAGKIQLVVAAGGALLALLALTVLSVFKPTGRTPYGWRKWRERRRAAPVPRVTPRSDRGIPG